MDRSIGSALNELSISENGRIGRKRRNNNNNKDGAGEPYKSKNLFAERNRREKLHNKLMELRGLVPIITNMKKATIVEDAIAHIHNLEETVNDLKDQLCEAEASLIELSINGQVYAEEEFKEPQIQPDISVVQICENKLWIKAMFEKKRGGFTRLIEALSALGFEVTDTSLTTFNEAMLVTSCAEGYPCQSLAVQEMKEVLVEIFKGQFDFDMNIAQTI